MDNKLSQFMFDNIGVPKYQKYLNLASLKHRLISGNVANVSTPGYRAKDIDFKEEFARATAKTSQMAGAITHPGHIPLGQHEARPPEIEEERVQVDEMNSVDIDREVSNLARNELSYTIAARLIQKKFAGMRKAIRGR
jgi:flagellar basal-body rod protein FlgB